MIRRLNQLLSQRRRSYHHQFRATVGGPSDIEGEVAIDGVNYAGLDGIFTDNGDAVALRTKRELRWRCHKPGCCRY